MWKDLNMQEKSEVISLALKQGIYSLKDIRELYDNSNQFEDGGRKQGQKVTLFYDRKRGTWLRNNQPVEDGYIAYDIKHGMRARYNKDGTKDYFVKDNTPYQSPYTFRKAYEEKEKATAEYVNKNGYDETIKGFFDRGLSRILGALNERNKERYEKRRVSYNSKLEHDFRKNHPIQSVDQDRSDLSANFSRAVQVEQYRPNHAREIQWGIKNVLPVLQEEEKQIYVTRDPKDSESVTLLQNGVPIVTSKALLRDIADTADKVGIPREEGFSLAYGETNFGTQMNWVQNFSNNHNSGIKGYEINPSQIVNNHIYQSGANYPAIAEYGYATGQNLTGNAEFPQVLLGEEYYKPDITKARADKMIHESDSIFKARASNGLEDFFIRYKKDPNSINPKNSSVDAKRRTYQQKVKDNISTIRRIKALAPYLYK